ncbi:MAG: LacI family DNA-binding transcriptional regulator [Beduini sp.]|uniref:LacI family DNA-binding transcriptional regulator n=1 Tax=Beduini sp. TaxID=1922300 RepID=UPI003990D770
MKKSLIQTILTKIMDKKVTIYDVAREANVSLATVSRVINGSSVVKQATKARVLEVIERLDFKPNEIARGLAKSKTTTIAVVFPQSLFAHVKDMIGGIGDTSRTLKYTVTFHTTDDIGEDNMVNELVEKLVKSRADGVILFNNEFLEEEISQISKYKIPIVVVGDYMAGDNLGSIHTNVKQAIYDITCDRLEKGIDDILFVTTHQNLLSDEEMVSGIKEAYAKYNKTFDQILESSSEYEESYKQFQEYFKTHKHQLVIATNDKEGVAVINGATDNQISIPDEMEVIGMFNTTYALMSKPTLTSINIPIYNMGALAVRLLTKMLNNEEIESNDVEVKYILIQRQSTK